LPTRPAARPGGLPEHHPHFDARPEPCARHTRTEGRFEGYSLRVPTPTVSVLDFTADLKTPTTTEELRQALIDASNGELRG